MTGDRPEEMPVFPLGTVLHPGQVLPLQVFEPRYRVLMFDLRDRDPAEFVVTLIERGSEVGGGDVRSDIGCVARIVQREEMPDGRVLLAAVGARRVRVLEWLEEDPYPRALVAGVADSPWPEADAEATETVRRVTELARAVAALSSRLGAPAPAADELDRDPVVQAWQIGLLAPLATIDRQRLLVEVDPVSRWRLLEELLAEQQELLAARVEWGSGPDGADGGG